MKKRKLYLGPQLRRLRRSLALTQAAMADELGISPSYMNLIERNQRPASADLLIRLAQTYDFDIGELAEEGVDELFASLADAFSDPIFQRAGVTREDAHELAAGNPVLGDAVASLYRAYRAAQAEATEARAAGRSGRADPVEEVRAFIAANRNHFPQLEEAAETISREGPGSLFDALASRMRARHGYSVRVLPADLMVGAYRRQNRHGREIAISESLDLASRTFQLALQIVLFECGRLLDGMVNDAKFETDEGRRLSRSALANYASAAILMPYEAYHKSAESLKYDIEALSRRFGVSFEQAAHRLTTLQRPGAEGVSFFFLRVDAAGNISKRFSGDVFPFARYGGSCPLWNVHEVFRTPRRILTQVLQLPDGSKYFSVARTVHGGAGGFGAQRAERAVALGCALTEASRLVYAQSLDVGTVRADPIGVTCRLCERPDCAARAHPPLRRKLVVDDYRRLATPFSFEFD